MTEVYCDCTPCCERACERACRPPPLCIEAPSCVLAGRPNSSRSPKVNGWSHFGERIGSVWWWFCRCANVNMFDEQTWPCLGSRCQDMVEGDWVVIDRRWCSERRQFAGERELLSPRKQICNLMQISDRRKAVLIYLMAIAPHHHHHPHSPTNDIARTAPSHSFMFSLPLQPV